MTPHTVEGTTTAAELASIGCSRSYENAHARWKVDALLVVREVASANFEFTVDDVWQVLSDRNHKTHNGSAIGGVMKVAASRGYVQGTDQYRKSSRPATHGRPLPVWGSRLFGSVQ